MAVGLEFIQDRVSPNPPPSLLSCPHAAVCWGSNDCHWPVLSCAGEPPGEAQQTGAALEQGSLAPVLCAGEQIPGKAATQGRRP